MPRSISALLPLLLYMTILSTLTHIPGEKMPEDLVLNDLSYHFIAFFIFGILLLRTLYLYNFQNVYIYFFTFSTLYSLTDELTQHFIPGRFVSSSDLFSNIAGAYIVAGLYFLKKRVLPHATDSS